MNSQTNSIINVHKLLIIQAWKTETHSCYLVGIKNKFRHLWILLNVIEMTEKEKKEGGIPIDGQGMMRPTYF